MSISLLVGRGELIIITSIYSKLLINSIIDEVNTQCFPINF